MPQALLGGAKELLEDTVGSDRDGRRPVRLVAGHGMAGESVAVAVRTMEYDAVGLEASQRAGGSWFEPLWRSSWYGGRSVTMAL